MAIEWVACDMKTGRVICDLPLASVDDIEQAIGAYSSTTAQLPVVEAPPEWENATVPGASYLVMLSDGMPLWGAFITSRTRGHGDIAVLSLASVEAYLDRRFVGDRTFTNAMQTYVVATLVNEYAADSLNIRTDWASSSTGRTRTYYDNEDKSVLSAISELAAIEGGPEWVVSWEESTSGSQVAYRPVLTARDRLGIEPTPGLAPAVSFDMPGPVTSVELVESFASREGATSVMATSTADGDQRPESSVYTSADPIRPTFEHRFTPSTSITNTSTLDAHARSTLERMRNGSVTLSLSLNLLEAPPLGIDWGLGDRIGFQIGGTDGNVPAFPGGLYGTARVVAWTMSGLDGSTPTITPTLTEVEF